MKLTQDNIQQIDSVLYQKYGVLYYDVRLEILDHLASELEQEKGDFEMIFPTFIANKKDFIQQTNINLNRSNSVRKTKALFSSIFSLNFLIGYLLVTVVVGSLTSIYSKEWVLNNFDGLPMIIPAPISVVLLYIMFFSKRWKSSEMMSLMLINNMLLLGYLFWFIHIVRKIDNVVWIPVFSFFITLSIAYYFFFSQLRSIHIQKYNTLIKR